MPTKSKAKPLPIFVAHVQIVRERLARLQALADDHFGVTPEEVNWGHAGSVAHIKRSA